MKNLVALAILAVAQPAVAQELPVELNVPTGMFKVGDEVEIEVVTGAPWTIIGFQFDLNYDPSILQPVGTSPWTPGEIWTGSLFEVSNLETGPGQVQYVSIDLGYDWDREAGVIARVRFKVVGTGTCVFSFGSPGDPDYTFPVLIDETNSVIPVVVTLDSLTATEDTPPPPPPPPTEDPAPAPAPVTGGGSSGGGGGGCSAGAANGGFAGLALAVLILSNALIRR